MKQFSGGLCHFFTQADPPEAIIGYLQVLLYLLE
jgi:hypothetical protein